MRAQCRAMLTNLRPKTAEDWFVWCFALSTFVGVWYALPMLNIIKDTSGFSGGVLRSIEAHSLLPNVLDYGTVTFYICYAVIAVFLALALPFYHFSVEAMKSGLLEHPEYIYAISRAVSASGVAILLLYVYRFLKEEVENPLYRLAIITSVFGNILVAALTRSGKVWVLSTVFGTAAVIVCLRSLRNEQLPGKKAALSLFLVALAAANFILTALYGIVLFIFAYFYRRPGEWKKLAMYALGAALIFIGITALDYQNLYNLVVVIFTGYHPLLTSQATAHVQLSFFPSLGIHFVQLLEIYPLVLLLILFALWRGIAHKRLLWVGIIVAVVYFLIISFVGNWYSDTATYMRYLYPLGFLFIPILAALKPPPRSVTIAAIALNTIIYLYTIILLSIPATYNLAANAIIDTYGSSNAIFENHIFELDLPMNKQSYALLDSQNCATKCQNALAATVDIPFKPIVETIYSTSSTEALPRLVIVETPLTYCGKVLLSVPGGTPTQHYIDIEYGLGTYLDPSFYTLHALGKHIFVYDRSACPSLVVPEDTPDTDTL